MAIDARHWIFREVLQDVHEGLNLTLYLCPLIRETCVDLLGLLRAEGGLLEFFILKGELVVLFTQIDQGLWHFLEKENK